MTNPDWPTDIVTLNDVKAHLNITGTQDDDELSGFISAATSYVTDAAGPIIPQSVTENYDGGAPIIAVRQPPVLTFDSVTEFVGGGSSFVLEQVTLDELGDIGTYSYTVESYTQGIIRRRFNGGVTGSFVAGPRSVQVTYTAGVAAIDGALRMATLQDIAALWQSSQAGTNPYGSPDAVQNGPLTADSMYPRIAAILSPQRRRLQAIG